MRVLGYDVLIEALPDKEGGGYTAIVPALSGCTTNAGTLEAAEHAVFHAIVNWTATAQRTGREIPYADPWMS